MGGGASPPWSPSMTLVHAGRCIGQFGQEVHNTTPNRVSPRALIKRRSVNTANTSTAADLCNERASKLPRTQFQKKAALALRRKSSLFTGGGRRPPC